MGKVLDLPPERIVGEVRGGNVTVCVVGLGYVGLPLALLFTSEGARVIGCDVRVDLVKKVNRGESPIVENDVDGLIELGGRLMEHVCPSCGVQILELGSKRFCPHCLHIVEVGKSVRLLAERISLPSHLKTGRGSLRSYLRNALDEGRFRATTDTIGAVRESDVVLITVGTPISRDKKPDYQALASACSQIGRGLTEGTLVILKSTVSPGTTEEFVAPILERESGLKARTDFGLAHMPERVLEGLALFEFRTLARIVGGLDPRSAKAASAVFSIFPAPIYVYESPKITEAAKLFENIYRDVNIALANEFAMACEALDVDVIKAIEAAHTDPKTHLLIPGPGVGGYCLTKDPYYLVTPSKAAGFSPRLIPTARRVNDAMPRHVIRLVEDAFRELGSRISGSTVAVLGLTFKGNSGDLRSTPVLPIVQGLLKKGAHVIAHDPLANPEDVTKLFASVKLVENVEEAIEEADCVVVTTDHAEYRSLSASDMARRAKRLRAIVDARHVFKPVNVKKSGFVYRGVGRTSSH